MTADPAPDDLARRIRHWPDAYTAATITAAIDDLPADHELLTAVDRIVDLANSEDDALRGQGLGLLFGDIVEALNDRFSARGRGWYSRLFARVIARCAEQDPDLHQALATNGLLSDRALYQRHQSLRDPHRAFSGPEPKRIAILSRVTIGADILLSTVLIQHLQHRFPHARILLIGDKKLQGLFGAFNNLEIIPLHYARRGRLTDRLRSWLDLRSCIAECEADLVVAPDSRLDQLGLLPVIADERYLLWENLQASAGPAASLAALLDGWCQHCFASEQSFVPRLALDAATSQTQAQLAQAFGPGPCLAVKLDHGGNAAKALPRDSECAILAACRAAGWRIVLDRGFGDAELAASDALLAQLGWQAKDLDDSGRGLGTDITAIGPNDLADTEVIRFHGSIAGWAACLANCRKAFSYDSVGHHLAAALGIPLVTAFTGHEHDDFPIAWQPRGPAAINVVTIPTADKAAAAHIDTLISALGRPD